MDCERGQRTLAATQAPVQHRRSIGDLISVKNLEVATQELEAWLESLANSCSESTSPRVLGEKASVEDGAVSHGRMDDVDNGCLKSCRRNIPNARSIWSTAGGEGSLAAVVVSMIVSITPAHLNTCTSQYARVRVLDEKAS